MFEGGSIHLIHGKTTISPVNRDTPERQHGSSKAAPLRIGKPPNQVLFYGFMVNVSSSVPMFSQGLIIFPPDSGRWKKCYLVGQSFDISHLVN
jgi:hypothetical protein